MDAWFPCRTLSWDTSSRDFLLGEDVVRVHAMPDTGKLLTQNHGELWRACAILDVDNERPHVSTLRFVHGVDVDAIVLLVELDVLQPALARVEQRQLHIDGGVPLKVLCRHTALIEVLQEPFALIYPMVQRLSRGGVTIIPPQPPASEFVSTCGAGLLGHFTRGSGPVIGLKMRVHEHVGEPLLRNAVILQLRDMRSP